MRLLTVADNGELSLTSDLDDDVPPYAILSHTWGADDDEITFSDLQLGQRYYGNKAGYKKIEFCGAQARKEGINHFWVDTCCIDKANNTELTEAITSMYKWYGNAQKCYVYLADVPISENDGRVEDRSNWMVSFRESRWFGRGWTLQELLAPRVVAFFSSTGYFLGKRETLAPYIHEITGIPIAALHGISPFRFSIGERWQWAQGRRTRRREDRAYCLLGVFNVFMPLIYGEGDNALRRLEKEIREQSGTRQGGYVGDNLPNQSLRSSPVLSPIRTAHVDGGGAEEVSQQHGADDDDRYDSTTNPNNLSPQQLALQQKSQILLESLAFVRMNARSRNVADALSRTCQWLQNHACFRAWSDVSQVDRHGGFLWIKGNPGSGKSTNMKAIVTWAEQEWSSDIILTYFFNARSPDLLEKSSQGLYRSIIYQLLTACPDYQTWLGEAFSSKEREGKVVEPWKRVELQNFLKKVIMAPSRRQVTLFVDALDEGVDDDVRDMVDYLERLTQQSHSAGCRIRVCLASRHYPHITIRMGTSITLEEQVAHGHDIYVYISNRLLGNESTEMSELRNRVRDRSRGAFLWVVLVVSSLNKLYDEGHSLRRMLRHLEKVPPTLHDMYAEIFSRDRDDLDQCTTLFRWVLFTLRPLSPAELYIAVQIGSSAEDWDNTLPTEETMRKYLLNCSRGLIEITKTRRPEVQFIHETVRDFLLGNSAPTTGSRIAGEITTVPPIFEAHRCHHAIAEDCLQFLSSIDRMAILYSTEKPQLVRYAIGNWWRHADAGSGLAMGGRLYALACEVIGGRLHLLNWLQRYGPDQHVVKAEARSSSPPITDDDLASPLYYAVSIGLTEVVSFLLKHGAHVNAKGGKYGTPLLAASNRGYIGLVELLLDVHVDFETRNDEDDSALTIASRRNDISMVKLLLDRGADINARPGSRTALITASTHSNFEVVQILLERGANISIQGRYWDSMSCRYRGGTALRAAKANNHMKVVQLLLEHDMASNGALSKINGVPVSG